LLTEQEKSEIDVIASLYPTKRAAGPDALKIVQKYRGWISDETLRDTAAYLDMTPEELDSIATFYSLIFRKPVGKHIILVCDSVTCWILGSDNLTEHLKVRLGAGFGETTADGRFTLLPISCLGACDHSPAMMIDDKFFGDLDVSKIDSILDSYS
jgi:NADH-quinone oxidoreductase subunit E